MILRWVEFDYWKSLLNYKIKEDESESDDGCQHLAEDLKDHDELKSVEKIVEIIVEKKSINHTILLR
jgi:hypothetical protein